ncbi:hypothetical protein [Streptomyces sp. TR02-1]|uniref:hypothetical protein n=1 Tax=Streptomyces sp. TR02-1 TaxID=3385977 RepID=UPI00399F44F6
MATDFVLDADEEDEDTTPQEGRPSVPIRIGGKVYQAMCPKDVLWAQFAASQNTRDPLEMVRRAFQFLDGAFSSEVSSELERRYTDPKDPVSLKNVVRAARQVEEHYGPQMREEMKALGLDIEQDSAANREERRSEEKATGQRKTTKKTTSAKPRRRTAAKAAQAE